MEQVEVRLIFPTSLSSLQLQECNLFYHNTLTKYILLRIGALLTSTVNTMQIHSA